jgi:cell division protein FtsB
VRAGQGRRRLSGLLAVAALVGVVVTAAGIFPFRQIIGPEKAVGLAREKLAALEGENARLVGEAAALQSDSEIERLAREQFGLVMPGEIGFVVVSPPGEVAAAVEPEEPTLDRPGEQPWWKDVWDFLTGRDLAQDG